MGSGLILGPSGPDHGSAIRVFPAIMPRYSDELLLYHAFLTGDQHEDVAGLVTSRRRGKHQHCAEAKSSLRRAHNCSQDPTVVNWSYHVWPFSGLTVKWSGTSNTLQ